MQIIKIGGESYTVQFGFAAANLLQETSGKPLLMATALLAQGDISLALDAFYAGTRIHHGALTRKECEALFDIACTDGTGIAVVLKALSIEIGHLLNLGAAKDKPETPQKKASGSTAKAS